ncbi:hypothetical protein LY76DRAFT_397521 [Colletotrichum caudatum]|nr:hypothetical protein LY76DRAFT_397521 [Colletotrichum caudatum]
MPGSKGCKRQLVAASRINNPIVKSLYYRRLRRHSTLPTISPPLPSLSLPPSHPSSHSAVIPPRLQEPNPHPRPPSIPHLVHSRQANGTDSCSTYPESTRDCRNSFAGGASNPSLRNRKRDEIEEKKKGGRLGQVRHSQASG